MFAADLLRGKRVLVTGGGTGLGKAMSTRFLELGASVHICGRRPEVLKAACAELAKRTGGTIQSYVCDVRELAAVEAMIEDVWRQAPLDVVVNNAAGNFLARTEDISPHAWEAVIGIVLMGTINITTTCGRRWLQAGQQATVLNILATYASSGAGSGYVVPSAVSKAGVMALTRSLAVEWGQRGIRFNAIAPGPVRTEGAFSRLLPRKDLEDLSLRRNPLRRFGTPEELANLAAFLVSDACTYLNGEVITMDGGQWLYGAGAFNQVGEVLSEADWQALKPQRKR